MSTLIFYEKPGCATNARQKRLLIDAGHQVIARDILSEPWTAPRLRDFFAALPVDDWFNRAAPQLKSGEIDPARIDAQTALELMLSNPLLIRRPLIEADGWRLAGFDAAQIEQRLGVADNRDAPRSLEQCSRPQAATPCPTPPTREPHDSARAQVAFDYHERTKHRPDRYASGPETLDWTSQPDPFRSFKASPSIRLPLCASRMALAGGETGTPEKMHSPALSLDSLGALLELSLGLSAWKEYGPDRWALRCNPSSGNLHPTEAYVIAHGIQGLDDGLYHYASRSHALEQRCDSTATHPSGLWIGLTSIHWREAWKYGERAFRYCQLDVGHALAALRYAAGLLGWQVRLVASCGSPRLTALLGTGRDHDYAAAEREEPDLLLQLINPTQRISPAQPQAPVEPAPWDAAHTRWMGQANLLDPHPMYHWPVIDEVASATESHRNEAVETRRQDYPPGTSATHLPTAEVIRGRRSAQRFDAQFSMAAADFYHLVDSLLPRSHLPWDIWDYTPQVHPVFFVHRVEGVPAGLYILVREAGAEARLRAELSDEFEWQRVESCPAELPLFHLQAGKRQKLARVVCCQQAIAADSCFALGMLAEFEPVIRQDAWRYRQLHWEAGLLGHVLYLQAETLALRGTGIGCFLDDAFHELLGLRGRHFQSLYHFTVGRALSDTRITTLPPYPDRVAAAGNEIDP
ncbi:MAG: ArsC/Spx/MgsR family protein [Thiobacillus sp.]|nr:ArsC/Spx/MgsR family protein [Thiobacillus sp.]